MNKSPNPQLRHIALHMCDHCLNGEGGICHFPGCVMYLRTRPDIAIPRDAYELVPDVVAEAVRHARFLVCQVESELTALQSAIESLANP